MAKKTEMAATESSTATAQPPQTQSLTAPPAASPPAAAPSPHATAVSAPTSKQVSTPSMKFVNPFGDTSFPAVVGGELSADDLMAQIDQAQQDNIGLGEIQISRIQIGQNGTPEIAGEEEGWKGMAGCLIDNLNRQIISIQGKYPWLIAKGADPTSLKTQHYLPVVPVFKLPTEYVKWPSKEERDAGLKRFHWKSLDIQEQRVREGLWKPRGLQTPEKGVPPIVTEHINWLVYPLDQDLRRSGNVIVATFSRTSFKAGGKLSTNIASVRQNKRLPAFGCIHYLFTGSPIKNERGTFYALQTAIGPDITKSPEGQQIYQDSFSLATMFANPKNGRDMQNMYIQAAAFTEDDDTGFGGEKGEPEGSDDATPEF